MQRRHSAGGQQNLEVHHGGDRQPAFHSGRPAGPDRAPPGFVIAHKEVEFDADPEVEQQEDQLKGMPQALRPVGHRVLPQPFSGFGGGLDGRNGGHGSNLQFQPKGASPGRL